MISSKQLVQKIKEWESKNPNWSSSKHLREQFVNMLKNILDDKETNSENVNKT